ncbi:MAG: phospholipase D-like domain-containing protein, partial [Desulfofustis sp.]
WLPGLKKSSLHAKAMVIDRQAVFVGSMNLDLRSLGLNNEIGILAYNQELAGRTAQGFDDAIAQAAFRLRLIKENGETSIRWHLEKNGEDMVYDEDPYVGFWTKLGVWFIGLLPVESLL